MKILGNTVVFVLVYVVFMIPTYVLPYFGSNSAVLNAAGRASGAGISPAFWPHLASLVVLVVITYFRSILIGKKALLIFPILALLFDLVPVLSSIPFVPTVMHLLAIVLGVTWAQAAAKAREQVST